MNFPLFKYDLFSNSEFYLFFYGIVFLDLPRYGFSILINALLISYVAPLNKSFMPKITVVVASHNGAGSITQAIQSILNQSCPIHEIIVVDDCSSDETAEIIESAYKLKLIKIALFHSRRCGKSASVNHAARFATGDFILNIDDDTVLNYDAVENLVSVFVDENTVIASGALTIRNSEVSLVTSLQTIEYQLSIVGGRSFLDIFGAMPCCSGAFSMYRSKFFSDAGGLNTGPGEDLEITLRARHFGYDVHFVESARASILAPDTFLKLLGQRLRWDRDELNIRMNQFKEFNIFKRMNRRGEYFHMLDFLVFTLLPTILFLPYLIYIYFKLSSDALSFLIDLYVYVTPFYLFLIGINIFSTGSRLSIFDLLVTPIFPFYQGVLMKIFRLIAYVTEIIFRGSTRDDYVPNRIRQALYADPGSKK